jgi:hypothetical protein
MPRIFSCEVPVTVILSAGIPGKALPFTGSALRGLAHAVVYDAMEFTGEERGFYADGTGNTRDDMSVSWLLPHRHGDLAEVSRRAVEGRRPCTTMRPGGGSTASG